MKDPGGVIILQFTNSTRALMGRVLAALFARDALSPALALSAAYVMMQYKEIRMPDLSKTEFRTVIEDARARHGALVALIYATDTQALSLLRLFTTLAVATGSGAIAAFASASIYSLPIAASLGTATIIFVAGASLCLAALKAARISLPGRKADFWKWAVNPKIKKTNVLSAYLSEAEIQYVRNQRLNATTSKALKWAKRCTAAAPAFALLAGAAAIFWKP